MAGMLSEPLIDQILSALPGKRIGVVGDLFLDRYLDIDAALTEPSIETGLDAYQVVRVRSYPGRSARSSTTWPRSAWARSCPSPSIGDDGEGYELRQALDRMPAVEKGGLYVAPQRRTPTYTKPMLGRAGEVPRELNRLDIKNRTPTPAADRGEHHRSCSRFTGTGSMPGSSSTRSASPTAASSPGRVRDRIAELARRHARQVRPGRQPGERVPLPQRLREAESSGRRPPTPAVRPRSPGRHAGTSSRRSASRGSTCSPRPGTRRTCRRTRSPGRPTSSGPATARSAGSPVPSWRGRRSSRPPRSATWWRRSRSSRSA